MHCIMLHKIFIRPAIDYNMYLHFFRENISQQAGSE